MLLALSLQAAVLAAQPAADPKDQEPIVIVARRLPSTKRALQQCLERHCPPLEDIAATLAYSEQQFLSGDYAGARDTLYASRWRNLPSAKDHPLEVADLLRADAMMASLNGLPDWRMTSQISAVDALKKGLAGDDRNVLLQRLQIGDSFVAGGKVDMAFASYGKVVRQARKAGLAQVEGQAMMRIALLGIELSRKRPEYRGRARRAIADIRDTTAAGLAPFRAAVPILMAKLDAVTSPKREAVQAVAQPFASVGHQITLISERSIDPSAAKTLQQLQFDGEIRPRWADVGFHIGIDGRVTDVKVLGRSEPPPKEWLSTVLATVASRRYSQPPSGPLYKAERFSLVFDRVSATGTGLATPAGTGRIEVTELATTADIRPDVPFGAPTTG